jgi:spore maturation protein CgeB
MNNTFDIVILGLTVTSSWGNGHATTYRSLLKGLASLGDRVLFLERDMPWYAANRDNCQPSGATTELYQTLEELISRFEAAVSKAQLVIVGSYVPDGIRVGKWVCSVARGKTAFYDIDTPVTMSHLESGACGYINKSLIRKFDAYLSFTGGPVLRTLENTYGSPMARALFCSVDTDSYRPCQLPYQWDLGYLGTYSEDRQPFLQTLLCQPARRLPEKRFSVAGPQYPEDIEWPRNVDRMLHVAPSEHPSFYGRQRFTLNLTRKAMKDAGYSPSVRLFEAAACQVPIISDWWTGLDTLFTLEREILVAADEEDMARYLQDCKEPDRSSIAARARARILAEHTPRIRALQLKSYLKELHDNSAAGAPRNNGRGGQAAVRASAGLASERCGEESSRATGAEAVGSGSGCCLHQPAGTGS